MVQVNLSWIFVVFQWTHLSSLKDSEIRLLTEPNVVEYVKLDPPLSGPRNRTGTTRKWRDSEIEEYSSSPIPEIKISWNIKLTI